MCADVKYRPRKEDPDLDLKLNGETILEKDLDIKELSKECIGIPHIKKAAELCALFSNITISTEELDACIDISVESLGATILTLTSAASTKIPTVEMAAAGDIAGAIESRDSSSAGRRANGVAGSSSLHMLSRERAAYGLEEEDDT